MRFRSLFALIGLAELGLLIGLGVLTDAYVVIGVLLGTMIVGAYLLRRPGTRIGGVLLLVPGLLTDVLGLVLLLPGPRRWLGRIFGAWFLRGVPQGTFQRVVFTHAQGGPMPPPGWAPPQASGGVVEAEVIDVKPSKSESLPPGS